MILTERNNGITYDKKNNTLTFSSKNKLLEQERKILAETLKSDIKRDILLMVDTFKTIIPSLNEIRVFGDFITEHWDPEKSDIDIMIETNDEHYSVQTDLECTREF